jgi:hypothetical protein
MRMLPASTEQFPEWFSILASVPSRGLVAALRREETTETRVTEAGWYFAYVQLSELLLLKRTGAAIPYL